MSSEEMSIRSAAIHVNGDWIETTAEKAQALVEAGAIKPEPGWSSDYQDAKPTDYFDVTDSDLFSELYEEATND